MEMEITLDDYSLSLNAGFDACNQSHDPVMNPDAGRQEADHQL